VGTRLRLLRLLLRSSTHSVYDVAVPRMTVAVNVNATVIADLNPKTSRFDIAAPSVPMASVRTRWPDRERVVRTRRCKAVFEGRRWARRDKGRKGGSRAAVKRTSRSADTWWREVKVGMQAGRWTVREVVKRELSGGYVGCAQGEGRRELDLRCDQRECLACSGNTSRGT
jgi:hypothetical protein